MLGCLEDYATLRRSLGKLEAAVRLCATSDTRRKLLAAPRAPRAERRWREGLSALRAGLGDAAFERAWSEGTDWEVGDAVRWVVTSEASISPEAVAA